VRQLLKLSIDVNERTSSGITPMHWACGMGDDPLNIKIVDLLLSHKGNPNIKSSESVTPVHVAASWGFLNVLKALVAQGGDPWVEDQEGFNAWDLALQKNHWTILKYLTSYMEEEEEEEVDDPAEISVQCVFVKNREVDLASSASLSNTGGSCNNQGFLCSESLLGGSYNNLNMAICQSANTTNTSSASSVVVVEEHIYSDAEKGVDLVEWHYPPLIPQDSITDATLNEALCSSAEDVPDSYMDSQLLVEELKSLGQKPGPITATTKQIYLRQLYRLRKEQAANGQPSAPSPHRIGLSKELQTLVANYPGKENDVKIASNLDRLLVTHFNCPDPAKPWREGLSKKSFNYLLLDPRVTHNLPLNESQDQSRLFKRFVSSIFYIGKGKQTRPHEHLYEAVKLRNRPQGFVKVFLFGFSYYLRAMLYFLSFLNFNRSVRRCGES